jgi:amino acid transporter
MLYMFEVTRAGDTVDLPVGGGGDVAAIPAYYLPAGEEDAMPLLPGGLVGAGGSTSNLSLADGGAEGAVRGRGYSLQVALEDIPLPVINVDVSVVAPSGKEKVRTLNIAPLVAIMYFAIAGGPEGTETMIQNGGPRLTILGIILCAIFWAAPTALMTAELSTRYPENGGFIIWARVAWGRFASGMAGWLQFCFTAADAALYPGLFLAYLTCSLEWHPSEPAEWVVKMGFVMGILVVNLSGASVVGDASMLLMACIITPFFVAVLLAFTGIFTGTTVVGSEFSPVNWLEVADNVDYPAFMNVLLWNMGMWESCSVCVGEVKNVPTAFPYALSILVVVVLLNYIVPIMAFTGLTSDYAAFDNGHYITIVKRSMSPYFAYVLGLGQCISSVGLFSSGIFKNAFMICGMSEQGMLPKIFATRSKCSQSPYVAILATMLMTLPIMSLRTFGAILGVEMVLYCLSLLLEISSLLRLRYITEEEEFDRTGTYMIPFGGILFPLFYLPSILICFYVIATASETVWKFSVIMVAIGAVLIIFLNKLETWQPYLFASTEGVKRHSRKRPSVSVTKSPIVSPVGSPAMTFSDMKSNYGAIKY